MVQHRLAVCESFNSVYIVLNKSNHFISKVFIGNNGHRKHGYEIKKKKRTHDTELWRKYSKFFLHYPISNRDED